MKQFSCPDCKVSIDTCEGCQRYCVKGQEENNIFSPTSPFHLPDAYVFTPYDYNCCKGCPNNPANGGSGICNCTLPYFEKIKTGDCYTINTTTTTSATLLINNTTDNGENV